MAEIRPFRGVRYNQASVKDLASVICPPHDVISPERQQELYHRSEYNFIRLEYGRKLPQDTPQDNRYARAAATLQQWLKQGVLKMDDPASMYLHDHVFDYHGEQHCRRGLVARVRLEEWDRKVVLPHEGTLSESKSDRLSLLWTCQANTSPIFALFENRGRLDPVFSRVERRKPAIDFSVDGDRHVVWRISDIPALDQVAVALSAHRLYIADGHHRYESALAYRRERINSLTLVTGEEGFNFVMMELVDFNDPGLLILPPHRLVRGLSRSALDEVMVRVRSFFDIEEVPLEAPDVWRRVDSLLAESGETSLVLFGVKQDALLVLRLHDAEVANRMMPYFHSELYKKLDVSIVDHIVLEMLPDDDGGRQEAIMGYSHNRQDCINRVLDHEYQLTFLVKPITAATIKAIADAGDRMPRKSTYFYPKLPSGLVFNLLTA